MSVPSVKSEEKAEQFNRVYDQLVLLYTEFSQLSRKKSTEAASKFKLGILNEYLSLANEYLGDLNRPIKAFKQFEESDIPNVSDIGIVLGMYLKALHRWWEERVEYVRIANEYRWIINGRVSGVISERIRLPDGM